MLNFRLNLVTSLFFDENLLGKLELREHSSMLLLVCSFNLVNCNNSVCADRKQPCVVKVQSNTLDCLAVGLNIKNLLEFDAALVFLFF
jgi:hypothetical protein